MHRRASLPLALVLSLAAGVLVTPTAAVADAVDPYTYVADISFPTLPQAHFTDTYDACRSGCSRAHQATDIIGEKMWPEYAVVDGVICGIDEGEEDSYGRHLTICGDDGNEYRYLHINNDTPGTDDGQATLDQVYFPGIRRGARVVRGQPVAYMGDSGNAEETVPHLHFDVFVPGVVNPWGEERVDPYPSLMAALERGDVPDGKATYGEPTERLAGSDRMRTAAAVAEAIWDHADTVVVAGAEEPQEALVAGPLAALADAPVLVTPSGELDPDVAAEIERLGATHAIVVGHALPDLAPLAEILGPEGTVERLAGDDAFATSARVAERVWELTGATGDGVADLQVAPVDPALLDPAAPVAGVAPTLIVATNGDRSGTVGALDGARIPADVDALHVWLGGVDPVTIDHVEFRIDRTDGPPDGVEWEWPYDLAGTGRDGASRPWPVGDLDGGEHTVTATIVGRDGDTTDVTATFRRDLGAPRRAILALGTAPIPDRAWPDALASSWYGAVRELPVLLTTPEELPASLTDLVASLDEVFLAGGTSAVSADQAVRIGDLAGVTPERLAGPDRYATAAAVADDLLARGLVDASTLYVATGHNWPDAITAAPAVAHAGSVLLLVHGQLGGSAEAERAIRSLANQVSDVIGLGGTAAIAGNVLQTVAAWAA